MKHLQCETQNKSDISSEINPFLAALAALEQGEFSLARRYCQLALDTNAIDRHSLARTLIGSTYTQLGRAAILANDASRGLNLIEKGMEFGTVGTESRALDLMTAEAERLMRGEDSREAIQRWQDILCLLGENAPQSIYERLSRAYTINRHGFGGTPEENHCWGDCHKHDVLERLHETLAPSLYLEIGVDEGLSLARAKGPALGVDPRPHLNLKVELSPDAKILPMSSDTYFRKIAQQPCSPVPELVFIDGMHLFEFALRDFINVERYAAPNTLVVIDDIYPCHPTQAARRRKSSAWTGDIWKLHSLLRETRPDLTLVALNAYTTGLLLIAGLDPNNTVLHDQYPSLVRRYKPIEHPPENALARHGAIPSAHPIVTDMVNILKQAKKNHHSVNQVQTALLQLRPRIAAAETEFFGRAKSLTGQCGLVHVGAAIEEKK